MYLEFVVTPEEFKRLRDLPDAHAFSDDGTKLQLGIYIFTVGAKAWADFVLKERIKDNVSTETYQKIEEKLKEM